MLHGHLRTVELREPHARTQISFYSHQESAKNPLHNPANIHCIHCLCESSRLALKRRTSRNDQRQVGGTAQLEMMSRLCEARKIHRKVPLRDKRQEDQDSSRVVSVSDLQRSRRLGVTTIQSRRRAMILIPHHEPRRTPAGAVPSRVRRASLCLQPQRQSIGRGCSTSRAV